MEINVNLNNNQKHWVLVILSKCKHALLSIWKYFTLFLHKAKKNIGITKQDFKYSLILLGVLALIGLGIWGYEYYQNEYIPEQEYEKAVAEARSKYFSDDDSVRMEYALKVLTHGFIGNGVDEYMETYQEGAFKRIEEKAYAGDPKWQFILAQIYNGQIWEWDRYYHEQNKSKAAFWWNEAAKQNYTPAFCNLGLAYYYGEGVKRNMEKAIFYIKKAAETGSPFAQLTYGDMYRDGVSENTEILLEKDIEKAKFWWQKAAANGNAAASERLQKIYD